MITVPESLLYAMVWVPSLTILIALFIVVTAMNCRPS